AAVRRLEDTADDAFLPPDLALAQLPVGREAGELGAGAGAARRAVVGPAGAENEVADVVRRVLRRAEELNVVNLLPADPGHPAPRQFLSQPPGVIGEALDVREFEFQAVRTTKEEPVPAPGDVAGDGADPRHIDADVRGQAVARHIF